MENNKKKCKEDKVEEATKTRDFFYIQIVTNDKYVLEWIEAKELQVEGIDFLLADKEKPADGKEYILVDRKASQKIKRHDFKFELYLQYPGKPKVESWSLGDPKTDNTMMIFFTDEMQVVTVGRKMMLRVMKLIEKEAPHLIEEENDKDRNGNPVKKYVVWLSKGDKYFKMMKPKVYDMTEKYYIFNDMMKKMEE